ncbi:phosphonate ABC transporter, permease protein PhnE [Apilactobacillus apisilvae]|uniref:Phosphonate ABC transporter, permease protein PhnE n=1 Tax=Apilactobacillus apisilvae TaxID=2923364 RepID=A0ABY4PGC5_9LACO|nr:phosphonate ABC transporter, permease protein PhnE [Apilactobacillus apisilvae]UQS84866.1 phosphonate ABC transporter, permease protein PhnE [Apilactobacillus apisilvae]
MKNQTLFNRFGYIFWIFIIGIIYLWAFKGLSFTGLQSSAGEVSRSIFNGLIHPDWKYVYNGSGEDLFTQLLQTLSIAFLGTFVASILSVPFSFWAARSDMKKKIHLRSTSGKVILVIIRTFPEIVLAIMFIKAVGPGSFAGVLALGIHSIGMLGKLFSESIENMDNGSTEAMYSMGGNKMDGLFLATFPAVMPSLLSYTLYQFEIAVRSASILGMVGAGGIGTPLLFAIQTRSWPRVGIILLGIIIMVTLIDWLSGTLRKRLV